MPGTPVGGRRQKHRMLKDKKEGKNAKYCTGFIGDRRVGLFDSFHTGKVCKKDSLFL
jgi:hypothetical protein